MSAFLQLTLALAIIILAAKAQGDARLIEEISDLAYHTLVLLAYRRLSPDDIRQELSRRHA